MAKFTGFQLCKKDGVPYWASMGGVEAKDEAQAKALFAAMKPKGVVEISKVVATIGTNKDENATSYQTVKSISARSEKGVSFYAQAKKPFVCDNTVSNDDVNAVLAVTNCFEHFPTEKPKFVTCDITGGNSRYVASTETTTTP